MKDLAPEILRQRLLIEGLYTGAMIESRVVSFLKGLASHLDLRTYGEPIVHSPDGTGSEDNQGFDAFIPLIDSGISLYVWTSSQFFSIVLFTCKAFDEDAAVSYARESLATTAIEWSAF